MHAQPLQFHKFKITPFYSRNSGYFCTPNHQQGIGSCDSSCCAEKLKRFGTSRQWHLHHLPCPLRKSPRKLTFGRCCKSRKERLTFAPRFDRRPERIEKRTEEKIKNLLFRLPVQYFFLPLHSQSQERELKASKTG